MNKYRLGQLSLLGKAEAIGFGGGDFYVEKIERAKANDIIRRNHYSGKIYNLSTEHHGVFIDRQLLGVLQWGAGMNPSSGGGIVEGAKNGEWLELNRMWLDDRAPRNSESKAISYSVKLLRHNRPEVKWLQSFADERCGALGVVYQASSFLYCGFHESIFWELDGIWYHNIAMTVRNDVERRGSALYLQENADRANRHVLRQFRYIRPLCKWARRNLLLPVLPYPKPADFIDRSGIPIYVDELSTYEEHE